MDWTAIIVSVFGSGGAIVGFFNYLGRRSDARKREANIRVAMNYAKIDEAYKALQTVRIGTRASRVCVLKTENGGGVPAPGCDVKSSVLYESMDSDVRREIASVWQKVPLNGVWAPILRQIALERCATLLPSHDLGPHFDFLSESECAKVHFVLIKLTNSAMFYLSVHLATDVTLTEREESLMYQSARRLNQLFETDLPIEI